LSQLNTQDYVVYMSLKRSISAKSAQSHGAEFETMLSRSAEAEGFISIRIADGCRQLGRNKLMRVKTPFDFVLFKSPIETIFVDSKTTNNKTFAYSSITPHQIEILKRLTLKGATAGYIVYFRPFNKVIWFSASLLYELNSGESLKPEQGILLGSGFNVTFGNIFRI